MPTPARPHGHSAPIEEILPIADRLRARSDLRGRGVTAAFLDSGFYAHPDLVHPRNRIRAYHDVLSGRSDPQALLFPDVSSWHGMMSSVVAAGNGQLSDGRYRAIGSEMEVVLLKVGHTSRIRHDDITAGIAWVIEHREELGIRILNISCAGDYEASYLFDGLSRMAEDAVRAGIVLVCAVGNAGNDPHPRVLPPASVPAVISVGGFNDHGDPRRGPIHAYHSSYGPTVDGLQKPEIIAPAIWIAAPILPGTPTKAEAELLAHLDGIGDGELAETIRRHHGVSRELDAAVDLQPYLLRELVTTRLRDQNVISGHYKHVDGTSFAAPIVTSVVAQMLEANPALTPQDVKTILIRTAERLPQIPLERQGWGVVQPAAAVDDALRRR